MISLFRSTALFVACLPLTSSALAARIEPVSVTASSTFPEESGVSYDPKKAADGKLSTSWVEGDQGGGLGAWISLDLGGTKTVYSLKVWGGMWYSGDYWKRGNRPREIEVEYSDGTKDTFALKNEMRVQDLSLPTPKKTTSVKIRLKGIYDGSTWLDTSISEVQVFDNESDAVVTGRSFKASSALPADADGNYDPANIYDGLSDSMWCEGEAAGDGTNSWVEVGFAGSHSVSKVNLVNGMGTSLPFWMKANRVTAATLTFSDGASETIAIKNQMMPQTVAFPAHATSSVKMTFTTVVKGKEFNDLCISEATFSE